MQSTILSAFSRLWKGIMNIITCSLSYRVFSTCSGFIKGVVKNSAVLGGLMKPVDYEKEDNSRFHKLTGGLGRIFGKSLTAVGSFIGKIVKSSSIMTAAYDFYSNLLFWPLKSYGLMALVSSLTYIMMTALFSVIGPRSIIASAVLLVVGVPLMFAEVNLYTVLKDSRVVRFIIGTSGSLDRLNLTDCRKRKSHVITIITMGIVIALMPVFLPTMYAAAGIAAVFAVPLVIIYPVLGLIGLALTIAFIPTMLAAGLIILTWAGVLLNCCTGKMKLSGIFSKGKSTLVYIFITLLGGILSFSIADSIPIALIYTAFISVVFLFILLIKEELSLKAVVLAAAAAAFGTALFGIYQYLTGNIEVGWIDSEMFSGMVRIYSTFENPNVYGEYLLFMIPMSLVFFFSTKRALYKLFWVGAGLLMVAAMLLTMSRGCWIGLAAGVFIYFLLADRRFLWLFFAAVVILPFVLPESIMFRIMSIGNLEDSSSLYRLYIWLGTFSMLKDYWLTGVGLGTKAFSGVYSAYAYNGIIAPHPHNLYLNIISETGIAGLLAFVWTAVTGLRNSVSSAISQKGFRRHFGAGLGAAFTGIFVQGVFDNVFYNYRIVLIFWMFIAFGFALALTSKKVEDNG